MFHPGLVIEVFRKEKNIKSIDNSVQITLEMWDENIITFDMANTLAENVKEDDIVLVDYRPVSEAFPAPRHKIIKVLKGGKGTKMWNKYREFVRKRKPVAATNSATKNMPKQQYIG